MADVPLYFWLLMLVGVVGIPAATAVGLARSAGTRRAATLGIGFAVTWGSWVVLSAVLADAGAYRQSSAHVRPWIGVAAVGALAVALLGSTVPAVAHALRAPGALARITSPQTFRVVGVVFLFGLALDELPAVFALPAGLGDLAIGIAAPFVARRLAAGNRTGAVWFHLLGILDLVVAVGIGFLAGLGPSRVFDVSPSTADLGLLPLVLIPTTAVPLALALHLVALRALRAAPSRDTRPAATVV